MSKTKLIGQRNGKQVVVQSFAASIQEFEPIAFPLLGSELDQHDPGGLNEESAHITSAAL